MTELIQALTDAGASIATIIVLAFLLIQQNKMIKSFQEAIERNTHASEKHTEAIKGLKEVMRGCGANTANKKLKKN